MLCRKGRRLGFETPFSLIPLGCLNTFRYQTGILDGIENSPVMPIYVVPNIGNIVRTATFNTIIADKFNGVNFYKATSFCQD